MNWRGRYFEWMSRLLGKKRRPQAKLPSPQQPPPPAPTPPPTRYTWVECHGYYDPRQAEIGRMLDDAQRWHGWPNCIPMVGVDTNWPLSRYPELLGRAFYSAWRWEQITDFAQFAGMPGAWLWVADGFEAGTGDIVALIACLETMHARGVIVQAGHVHGIEAAAIRGAGFDVQAWASCAQISHVDLERELRELRPSRFVGQVEGQAERQAMVEAINAGIFGGVPWDCVISGWGDFAAI